MKKVRKKLDNASSPLFSKHPKLISTLICPHWIICSTLTSTYIHFFLLLRGWFMKHLLKPIISSTLIQPTRRRWSRRAKQNAASLTVLKNLQNLLFLLLELVHLIFFYERKKKYTCTYIKDKPLWLLLHHIIIVSFIDNFSPQKNAHTAYHASYIG